jgi:hypothetical protein
MKRALVAALCVLLVSIFLPGCAARSVKPGVEYRQSRGSYLKVLKNWTREAERFDGLETDFLASATYWSDALTRAYVGERTRAEGLLPRESAALLERLLDKHERALRFRLTFYTVERPWNDLDKSPSSWKVYLIAKDGRQIAPVSVRALKVKPSAEELYFPSSNPWNKTYEVIFPKTGEDGGDLISEADGEFGLLVTGPKANATFVWRME